MGKQTEKKPALWLQVIEETSGFAGDRYYTQTVRIVQEETYTDRYPRRGVTGLDDCYGDGPLYSGLRIRCQGDDQSAMKAGGPVYGFDVEYRDVYSVDARKCKRMLKTLEMIGRGQSRLVEKRGYTQSWGDYLGRLAEILGCQGFVFKLSQESAEMRGETWDWRPVGEGVNQANYLVRAWQVQVQKRLQPESDVA